VTPSTSQVGTTPLDRSAGSPTNLINRVLRARVSSRRPKVGGCCDIVRRIARGDPEVWGTGPIRLVSQPDLMAGVIGDAVPGDVRTLQIRPIGPV